MLIRKIIDKKVLEVIIAACLAYYFGLPVFQSPLATIAFFTLIVLVILFLRRIEYFFYFLLAGRGTIDIFIGVGITEEIKMSHFFAVLIILLFFIYFIIVSHYNVMKMLNLGVNKIYGIFLIASLPAIIMAPGFMGGMRSWFRFLLIFVIINMTIFIVLSSGNESYRKKMNIICWSAVVSLIVPLTMFLKNVIQGNFFMFGGVARYTNFGAQINIFSYLLLTILPFCLFLYSVNTRKDRKILWLAFIAIIVFSIYMTNTRNIWIGLTLLMFSWNIFRKNFMIIFALICAVSLFISINPAVVERFEHIDVILKSEGGFFNIDGRLLSGRIGLWQNNLNYFIDQSTLMQKFIGNGFGVSEKVTELYSDLWHSSAEGEHNNYLTLLMTTGISGLSFYLLFILKLFQEAFKLLRRTRDIYFINLAQIFLSVLVSYVVISGFTHIVWHTTFQMFFSVFAGLIIAANILEDNRDKEEKQLLPAKP